MANIIMSLHCFIHLQKKRKDTTTNVYSAVNKIISLHLNNTRKQYLNCFYIQDKSSFQKYTILLVCRSEFLFGIKKISPIISYTIISLNPSLNSNK